jgi:hypothetical protein
MIVVNNPEKHIDKQSNLICKYTAKMSYKMYGSPVCIVQNSLKCGLDELNEILQIQLQKYKKANLR